MNKNWKLKNPKQCRHCPWRHDAQLDSISGYDTDQHRELLKTIATPGSVQIGGIKIMACHHSPPEKAYHCIGWLYNQLTIGNNISMRLRMLNCENSKEMEVFGEQYETLEETIDRDI